MTKSEARENIQKMLDDYLENARLISKAVKIKDEDKKWKKSLERSAIFVSSLMAAYESTCKALGIEFNYKGEIFTSIKNWGLLAD